ncbi:MAG: UPF0280 family protein [Candidatus Bathyarchaeota archaeon]|nr:UPF0280 family protein [Candidatus Bathyarchaeota archaeon]
MESSLLEYSMVLEESKIHIKGDNREAILQAIEDIRLHRETLVEYIRHNPEFQYALEPLKAEDDVPIIVKRMTESSRLANVGPMASVAGTLADLGLEAMLKHKAKVALVENGGEIAAYSERPITLAILSSSLDLSGKIGFHIVPEECPLGIATSSSKTEHAISFGLADSVTAVAGNASLADAAATAICNSVLGDNVKKSIQLGLRRCLEIPGVRGALVIREGHSGLIGRLPRVITVKE